MKRIKNKLVYISLLTALIITTASCSKKADIDESNTENATTLEQEKSEEDNAQSNEEENAATVDEKVFQQLIVEIGKAKVYYSEAMIYFKYLQAQNESYFGDKIWNYDFGGQTFGDMAKQEIINMIAQTKIIIAKADKYNVVLTEEEEDLIQQNAETFLTGLTEEDKIIYGLTDEVAQAFYRDNMLYEKVYDAATMNVDTDVSDKEAMQITTQHLFVSTTEKDKDGNAIPISKEKKAEVFTKAQELLEKAKTTDDFYTFAEANTEGSQVEYTFGKGEKEDAFEKVAFALKSGELSDIVETKDGYYIIYCVSDFDEDATLEKKEEIIEGRQDEAFQDLYEEWSADYKIDVNNKVWDTIKFNEGSEEQSGEEQTVGTVEETVEETTKN